MCHVNPYLPLQQQNWLLLSPLTREHVSPRGAGAAEESHLLPGYTAKYIPVSFVGQENVLLILQQQYQWIDLKPLWRRIVLGCFHSGSNGRKLALLGQTDQIDHDLPVDNLVPRRPLLEVVCYLHRGHRSNPWNMWYSRSCRLCGSHSATWARSCRSYRAYMIGIIMSSLEKSRSWTGNRWSVDKA